MKNLKTHRSYFICGRSVEMQLALKTTGQLNTRIYPATKP